MDKSIMATFADTILQAIFNYRQLLKRHFSLAERRAKLQSLGLRSAIDPTNEKALYELGHRILADLKANLGDTTAGYYSYSGIQKFIEHLEKVLAEHHVDNNQVIHKARQASRALLHAIQMLVHPEAKTNPDLRSQLVKHTQTIASHGSQEQHHHYRETLKKFLNTDQLFFGELLQEFEQAL